MTIKIGIDAGGTLVKVAYLDKEEIQFQTFSSQRLDQVTNWISTEFSEAEVCITGGKSELLSKQLQISAQTIVEFEATCKGVGYLAEKQRLTFNNGFIFANVGTGTSIHYMKDGKQERVGGIGVGGGTLLGLSYLVSGETDYEKIIQFSLQGNREKIDLKVKDIFEGAVPPISGDLTASNFGKLSGMMAEKPSDADALASVIGLIGETVVTICIQVAETYQTSDILYIGSTLRSNSILAGIMNSYTKLRGKQPFFLENGEFSGAIGALLSLDE
ncbi:type II pantothenate kinase [Radiobacillus kanasensis]|uniref:type II pantothenate kinase n=1 Tax=Radiobacillus kanasensis TaxID=2844358 RepID=UPI001E5BC109|nr:type II pantothenate kinase [Radiobacillus kanasensis]UFU00648.1 type II pantothenate kinase [Radiobacillus kanasensis]